jgi:hypothetical protein
MEAGGLGSGAAACHHTESLTLAEHRGEGQAACLTDNGTGLLHSSTIPGWAEPAHGWKVQLLKTGQLTDQEWAVSGPLGRPSD